MLVQLKEMLNKNPVKITFNIHNNNGMYVVLYWLTFTSFTYIYTYMYGHMFIRLIVYIFVINTSESN